MTFIALGAPAIFPGEHLLRDDVGFFSHAAGKQFRGLENRRADLVEVVGAENFAHGVFDKIPESGVRRKKIAGSSDGINFAHSVVSCQWLVASKPDCSARALLPAAFRS